MIRTAVIGLGKMGLSHLSIFSAHPSVKVVAVCDPTRLLVDSLKQFVPVKAYTDYARLLDAEELDAVVVATPPRFHVEIVRAALQRSLHVFCEKPFCFDPADGDELARLAAAKQLVNRVGYHYRHVGAFRQARRFLKAGAIGRVHHAHVETYGPVVLRPKGATWRANKAEGGGCLHDYASHAVDLAGFLFGPPREVRGTILGRIFSADVEDEVYSTLFYDDGMTGRISANWSDASYRKMAMKVSAWGDNGYLQADRQEVHIQVRDPSQAPAEKLNKGWNVRHATDFADDVWFYLRGEEYSAQAASFIDAVMGAAPEASAPTFQSTLETVETIRRMLDDAQGTGEAKVPTPRAKSRFGGLLRRDARGGAAT